ncbi:MAG: class II aldolase/adducin family protein [Gemmatimonadetes bacterium]|nr:class II aldolase/adducin family protein [Gemmatimonadota bacterium]MBI3567491.1 class II aldolase/adducin family protein [Gemmatimonadota bacterium]
MSRAASLAVRRAVVQVCRRLYERGLIAGQDGNVSVRLASGAVLMTPAGMSKVDVRPQDLVEVALDGRRLRGRGQPSSEAQLHLALYAARSDVGAVVHAHPPVATGFAVAGESLPYDALAELVYNVGPVPLVPFAMPGTAAVGTTAAAAMRHADAALLANHGAVTVGATLVQAHQRMESLEHAARIVLAARQIGRVTALGESAVRALEMKRGTR